MTRTCPYCGTKLKQKIVFFAPEYAVCPTCGKKPFQPVFKQLRAVRTSMLIIGISLWILCMVVYAKYPLPPEWLEKMMHNPFCRRIPQITLLVLIISPYYLTRDRHVKRMYEKEQHKETPNGT